MEDLDVSTTLAYRNLWRAPQRTLLTMGAMTTATTVLILTLSINLDFSGL